VRRLGFHVSIAGGLLNLVPRALARHCTTVQMFTSSPSQWGRAALDPSEAIALRRALREADIRPHFVHAIYLLNLASPDRTLRRRSVFHLAEELQRAALLGAAGVVFHLGSVGAGGSPRQGVRRLAQALQGARQRSQVSVPLILENGAGAGHTMGGSLEQIAEIMALAPEAEPLRLCLDTAHAFAAGLPVHTEEGLEEVLSSVQRTIGLRRLRLIHANDSRYPFAAHHDRHQHLGQGYLGREAFRRLVNHPRLKRLPFIMETPGTEADDKRNMRTLRRLLPPEERPPLRRPAHAGGWARPAAPVGRKTVSLRREKL